MKADLQLLELQRSRWRRARERLRLVDPEAEDFAMGGLARLVPQLSARFLVLPEDPEGHRLEFAEDVWQWWKTNHPNPFDERMTSWGTTNSPTAEAAVVYDPDSGKSGVWNSYLALHRHGGIEFGLGRAAAVETHGRRVFLLITIVARLWVALGIYGEVISRYSVTGPWEVTLALRNTEGADLGNFAEGWREPWDFAGDLPKCLERNLLFRRELADWPDSNGVQTLALTMAGWLDDAWGVSGRRVVARTGPRAGQFDASKYHL